MIANTSAPTVRLLIDGQFIESATTQWREVINPATQEVLARVPFATSSELNAAVESAKKAFGTWRKTSIGIRTRILLRYQRLIREHIKGLAAILTTEQGKTLPDAEGDIFRGLEFVEHATNIGALPVGELANNAAAGIDTYTLLQPLGVCAGVTPFNFPAMISLSMFPMAIATGNTFVLKPSEQDPLATMRLVELALEAGVPPGVLNVVHGGEEVVNGLCDHLDVKAISFVGPTSISANIYQRATLTGKRAQCIMGTKNLAVVLPDANREETLNNLVGAAFGAAGQRCMATSTLVLVGEARAWLPDLVEKTKSLKVSAGIEPGTDVGPVVSRATLERIDMLIEQGALEGAKLELDGRKPKVAGYSNGNFIAPTIFSCVKPGMAVYKQEIFGPVLTVLEANSLDEAIALINADPNGYGVALFTQSEAAAHKFQEEIDVGQVGINVPIPVPFSLPSFTGARASTLGELGPYGMQAILFYTQTKTVTQRWFDNSTLRAGARKSITLH